MENKTKGILEFATVLMNDVVIFLCVIWMIGTPEAWRYLVYGIAPFGFYFLRKKVSKKGPSLILHVLFLAVLIGISWMNAHSRVYILVSIVIFGYSVYIRTKREQMEDMPIPPVAVICIILLMQVSSFFDKQLDTGKTLVIGTIIYAVCYMICYYLQSFEKFVAANRSSTGYMPEKLILKSGFSIVGVYTAACTLILVICAYLTEMQQITKVIGRVLAVLFINQMNKMARSEYQHEYEYKEVTIDYGFTGPMEGETGIVAQILEYGFILLGIVIVCVTLYHLIKFIRKKFSESLDEEMQMSSPHVADKVEVVERVKSKKMWDGFRLNRTPQEKIRKAFRTYMNQKYKDNPEKAEGRTAREWLVFSDQMSDENKQDYARIYEKARYSEEECTTDDVKHMLSIKNRK